MVRRPHTIETRRKMSLASIGKPKSPTHVLHMIKNPKLKYNCKTCNKEFFRWASQGKCEYCCSKCYHTQPISENARTKLNRTGMRGALAGNWKGGKTQIRMLIPGLSEYRTWRSKVFERDDWTCQTCHARGVYLEAHHITPLWYLIEKYQITNGQMASGCKELWGVNNGVSLCKECHKLTRSESRRYRPSDTHTTI